MYKLVIANKNYSSWSLRAWLFLEQSQIPFETVRIPIFTKDWDSEIIKYSKAKMVPVLLDGDISVWDTMAIMEHGRDTQTSAVGWPDGTTNKEARAYARSIAAEMHSGFGAIRNELPQNLRSKCKKEKNQLSDDCWKDIARVDEIWSDCRTRFGGGDGPWLFGKDCTIADIMYAPVALRFVTYGIPVSDKASEFVKAVQDCPAVQKWIEDAKAEAETLPKYEKSLDP